MRRLLHRRRVLHLVAVVGVVYAVFALVRWRGGGAGGDAGGGGGSRVPKSDLYKASGRGEAFVIIKAWWFDTI